MARACPECRTKNAGFSKSCVKCGYVFPVVAADKQTVYTKKCPKCYGEVDERASVCPHCRKKIQKGHGREVAIGLGVLVIVAFCVFVFLPRYIQSQRVKVYNNIIDGLSEPVDSVEQAEPSARKVLYEVGGTAYDVHVVHLTGSGDYQRENIEVPESAGLQNSPLYFEYVLQPEDTAYIKVSNNQSSGTVACRITESGRVVDERSGTSVVSCSGE